MILLFYIDEVCPVFHKTCLDTFEKDVIHYKKLLGFKYNVFFRDVIFDMFSCLGVSIKKKAHVSSLTAPNERILTLRPTDVLVYKWIKENIYM